MCSISVCSLKLRPFIVWKLWPGQKFKVKSVLFQKSGADNFRTQTAIQILRPRCTTRHQRDSLWQVSNNSDGNYRRSCAHKKLLTDGQTDNRGYNIIRPFGRIKSFMVNSFKIKKKFRQYQTKSIYRQQYHVTEIMISVLVRVENNVGKRRKCWLPSFSPVSHMFSKAFIFRADITWGCSVMG